MKKWIWRIVVLAALAGGGWWGWSFWTARQEEKSVVRYRTAPVSRADVVHTVEATGTVKPIKEVEVGAQVNGRIVKLLVDYNSTVTNGQVVALIDPQVYDANYKSAVAEFGVCEANVRKCTAQLALAEKTLVRKDALVKRDMAPKADYDAALEARDVAAAALASAKASVEKARATMSQAKANLDYCTIISPVNGVVIVRSVDEGQTVVSSMNAVPLLTIAEDLKVIWVEASVPEADVGSIRVGQKVTFTADAYRRKFTGRVRQIRLASTTTSNVVTYPIIIEAENPGEMLFPGMTANISVEVERADDALCVTSAAFRFRPRPEHVYTAPESTNAPPPRAAVASGEGRRPRKVWVRREDGLLESVAVESGVTDEAFTQIKTPTDLEGREVIVGYEVAAGANPGAGDTSNPFMPKFPKRNKNKGTAPEPKK